MMKIIIIICILNVIIKSSYSNPLIKSYPIIDLLENSPLNTFVIELTNSSNKLILINLNEFETKLFSIINGNIYTKNLIDREEFLDKKYCLDKFYCKIELQILVDDGLAYWIIPIHIVDENDNKPEFAKNEIELKFVENVSNGYRIYFEGAKDIDEGKNSEIHYILDCSNNKNNKNKILLLNQSSINCFSLFELIIISQSSLSSLSNNFDKLALKYNPSLINEKKTFENEYKFIIYAIDNNENNKQLINSMNLFIKIEDKEDKNKNYIKFLLSSYEFVILLNETLNKRENLIGKIHAISNNPSDIIYYKILSNNKINEIKINFLTGELSFINKNNITYINNDIELNVEAFLLLKNNNFKKLKNQTNIKIYFRYFHLLKNISFYYENILFNNSNYIYQLNNKSNIFFINKNIQININLLKISLFSYYYPNDKFIFSLENYFNIFSLIPSSSPSLINIYYLKLNQQLISSNHNYLLNIQIKHKLSQQYLPNLIIQFIVFDQLTTTTTTTIDSTSFIDDIQTTRTTTNITTSTSISDQFLDESFDFCLENKTYILYDIKNNDKEIAFLKVIQSNLFIDNNNNNNLTINLRNFLNNNESEIILNECRMYINKSNNLFNKSFEYEICSFDYNKQCFNITFLIDEINSISFEINNHFQKWILPKKPIEKIMVFISIIFLIGTIILILLICRLKGFLICSKIKNYFFYGKKYGINNSQYLSSSFSLPPLPSVSASASASLPLSSVPPTKIPQRSHSIVVQQSDFSSFEPIKIKNDDNESYLFNIDRFLQREPLPKTNTFILPSSAQMSSSSSSLSLRSSVQRQEKVMLNVENRLIIPRTSSSSSSSFLQETKQLLEMISSNQNFDLSRLTSEI
ncbi:unnamed protein product [Rotaria sordida]|uniref:Cadherin domain-containing protein n=1 Tax=Rotaria sordida TaxID=392033 RepID=A0A814F7C8_9BILA|nr:unnamed protein product [Rotaria sordida]